MVLANHNREEVPVSESDIEEAIQELLREAITQDLSDDELAMLQKKINLIRFLAKNGQ